MVPSKSKRCASIFVVALCWWTCVAAAAHSHHPRPNLRRLLTTEAPYNWEGSNPQGANPETTTQPPSPSDEAGTFPFDVFNQRSYDIYDWVLYAFAICGFGCCCLCCGCFAHYRFVVDKIVSDEDIADLPAVAMAAFPSNQSVATPGTRRFSFAGFNLFGEKLRQQPSVPPAQLKPEKVISASTSFAPGHGSSVRHSLVSEIAHELHMMQLKPEESSARASRSSQLMQQLQLLSSTPAQSSVESVPQPKYQPAPPSMDPDEEQSQDSGDIDARGGPRVVRIMTNPDQKQRKALPRIIVPAKNAAIVPKYREDIATPLTEMSVQEQVQTPTEAYETSQTHLSMQIEVDGDGNDDGVGFGYRKETAFSIIKEDHEMEDNEPSTPF